MNELENIKSELNPFVGEQRLVTSAIAGDENAFSELYKRTYKGVYFIIKKYLSNDEDIYEAMQETYFKAYVNLRFLREPESFYNWLKIIAQNTAIDILKASGKEESFVEETANGNFDEDKNDLNIEIADILKKLEPQYADLLIKVYYDGLKVREIAKLYKIPKSTVYSRLKAAESKLREMLEIRGISGPLYSGDIASMLTLALRQIIGTDILKAAVMEEILQKVLKGDKSSKVVGALARKKRNAAVLRLTSIIMVFVVLITAGTIGIIDNFGKKTIGNFNLVTGEEYGIVVSTGAIKRHALFVSFIDASYAKVYIFDSVYSHNYQGSYTIYDKESREYYRGLLCCEITVKYKIKHDSTITLKGDGSSMKLKAQYGTLVLKECSSSKYEQMKYFLNGDILSNEYKMEKY